MSAGVHLPLKDNYSEVPIIRPPMVLLKDNYVYLGNTVDLIFNIVMYKCTVYKQNNLECVHSSPYFGPRCSILVTKCLDERIDRSAYKMSHVGYTLLSL